MIEADDSVRVIFDDPALVGTKASFICPSGLVRFGSNESTCMENGYWEPDPREFECEGVTL